MKKTNKLLVMLPLVATLASCGGKENIYMMPKGGTEVDVTNRSQTEDLASRIDDAIEKTFHAAQNSVNVKVDFENVNAHIKSDSMWHNYNFETGEAHYERTDVYNEEYEINKFNASIDVTALGLGGELKDAQASAEVNLKSGSLSVSMYETEKGDLYREFEGSVDFNNAKVNAWYNEGSVYADLTSPGLKTLAYDVGAALCEGGAIDLDEEEFDQLVDDYAGKWEIPGLVDEEMGEEVILVDEMLEELFDEVDPGEAFVEEVLGDEFFGSLISTKLYADGRFAAQASLDADLIAEMLLPEVLGMDYDYEEHYDYEYYKQDEVEKIECSDDSFVTATVIFNKDHTLHSVAIEASIDAKGTDTYYYEQKGGYCYVDEKSSEIELTADLSLAIRFDYSKKEVKFPNFSTFEVLDIEELM